MIRAAALAASLLAQAGCAPATPDEVAAQRAARPAASLRVEHDDLRQVTCWVRMGHGGVSCLPDWMLEPGRAPMVVNP